MACLLHCLLRTCFEDTPEESSDESNQPPQSNRILRLFQSTNLAVVDENSGTYRAAEVEDPAENDGDDDDDDDCCQSSSMSRMSDNNPHAVGLRQFWKSFKERFNLEQNSASTTTATEDSERERLPILTQASSFDSTKEVPTIQNEQIVLPGSDLQQEMAKAMSSKLGAHDDECVICMETFDPTNPRMPTLCGCGENKTYFHLPCLYQWIEQSRNCPSCRKRLRWEEF